MRRLFLGLGAIALAVAGCATERPVRSYVQPNYVDKAMFDGEWYFRQTIADVPPTTSVTFAGESSAMEKVRWEIQEKWIVAYRSYELIPGSVRQADPTNKGPDATRYAAGEAEGRNPEFKEAPIAAFPILKHFDIFRQYNTTTGEEINVLEENDRDRPWFDRKYIRVDWSSNLVVNFLMMSPLVGAWYVQDSEQGADRFRIESKRDASGKDVPYYFDFVTKLFVDPDLYGCILTLYNYAAEDCASAEVKVRSSFLKVDAPREFEPVSYDDLKMAKFGYFRTERLTYNRNRGITESGRIYLANVHNIFGQALERDQSGNVLYTDDNGEQVFYTKELGFHYRDRNGQPRGDQPAKVRPMYIPKERRPLKPVVYHLSPRYPERLIRGAELVAESWNKAFRRAAAAAQRRNLDGSYWTEDACNNAGQGGCSDNGAGGWCPNGRCDGIPDMFVLHYNGWVKQVGGQTFTDFQAERDADHVNQSVQWSHDRQYEVAQIGDLRYNVIYWVTQPQIAGPLGYGPSAADPESGEIISGTAYVYGAAVDTYATYALDSVKVLNGQVGIDEFVSGQTVRDYVRSNLDAVDPRRTIAPDLMDLPLPEAKARMLGPKKLAKLDAIREFGLEPARPGRSQEIMRRIKENGLDQLLINDEIRIAKSRGLYTPGAPMTDEERQRIDLTSWASPEHLMARTKARWNKALRNSLTLAEFADDGILGLAMQFAGRPAEDLTDGGPVWNELRTLIFRAVMEHEVGHTVGLRHNFQGSFDSMNYHDAYWELRKENVKPVSQIRRLSDATAMATQTQAQKEGSMGEYQYSTVMDYAARFNSDVRGIGKYDIAAVTFAYGNAVEVFELPRADLDQETQEIVDFTANKPSPIYDSLTEYIHYTQLPVRFGNGNLDAGIQAMRQRRLVNFDELQQARRDAGGDLSNIPLEVPYMFCSDDWIGAIASCQVWDHGADQNEMTQDFIGRYRNYYFFNNYKRDRHPFYADMVLERVFVRYLSYLPNMYQHWLFSQFYSSSVDGLGDLYWTISTFDGLNLISDILTTPKYGSYDCSGAVCEQQSYELGRGQVDIGVGPGRRIYSRYDWDSGYYLFDKTLEAGHFWDYLAGVFALVQSEATVLGIETASDFTTYLIPYYLVFEDETTKLVNGIYTRDYDAIAPRINNGRLVMYPAVDINGTNAAPAGKPVDLDINFTQQIYAMLYGMAFFTSSFSLHFPDNAQIFRLGAGEAVNPGEGYRLEQFTDPLTGHAYGALVRTTGTTNSVAAKVVLKGKDLAAQYNALKAQLGENPNPSDPRYRQLRNLEFEIGDVVSDINILRSLYPIFARTI